MNEDIRKIIRQEFLKCAKDPVYFMRKYCYISHPQRGKIKFNLYPFQEKTLKVMDVDKHSIILKSRQLGISTLVAGYSLWLMLFNKNKNILCIATKQETAKNMVTKVKFMYDNLPSWLKEKNKPPEKNKLSLKLNNGSQIKATSAASDAGRSEAVSLLIIDEAAFINGIDEIWASSQQTLATGGKCIALSTPYGTGNWFHKTWEKAEDNLNGFLPIKLPWFVHPERDQAWRDQQDKELGPKMAAQECDCDFTTSGDTVIHNDFLNWLEENSIKPPRERRGADVNLWVWESVNYEKKYMVVADVARGDGKDYSTYHVIEIESNTQVAEYKGQPSTRDFANMLVAIATEYNSALLVVENANVGWDVVQEIIQMGYRNFYHTPKGSDFTEVEDMLGLNGDATPGFTMSLKTRPLCINKLIEYISENSITIQSSRTLSELRTFIWKNGRAEAQSGYNDDLVMPLSISTFLRDTSLRFNKHNADMTRAALGGIKTNRKPNISPFNSYNYDNSNPYKMNDGAGGEEDISWLL